MRGQERRVGLDEDLVVGDQLGRDPELIGVGEAHSAGETEHEPTLDTFACNISVTGEAVHDHGSRGALRGQDVE